MITPAEIHRKENQHRGILSRTEKALGKACRWFVYALIDPQTKAVRYVGKTCSGIDRITLHFKKRELEAKTYKANWIRSLLACGFIFEKGDAGRIVSILEVFDGPEGLNDAEIWWIKKLRSQGVKLTNLTDGGDGVRAGYVHTPEAKERMSFAQKKSHLKLWADPKFRQEQTERFKKNCLSPDAKKKARESLKAMYDGDTLFLQKRRDAQQRRWSRPGAREKASATRVQYWANLNDVERGIAVGHLNKWTTDPNMLALRTQKYIQALDKNGPLLASMAQRCRENNESKKKRVEYTTGGKITRCDSILDASRKTGVSRIMISRVLNGEKPSSKGFTFRYLGDVRDFPTINLKIDRLKRNDEIIKFWQFGWTKQKISKELHVSPNEVIAVIKSMEKP